MSRKERVITAIAIIALNIGLITLAAFTDLWLFAFAGITFLPVLLMCFTNKPIY